MSLLLLAFAVVLAATLWCLAMYASEFFSCWRRELSLREVEQARRAHRGRR